MSAEMLTRFSKRAFASGDKAAGIMLKEAAKREKKRDTAYKLLLAYAEASRSAYNPMLGGDSHLIDLLASALEAAREAG